MTKENAKKIINEWNNGGGFKNLFFKMIQAADENNFLRLYLDLIQSPFFKIIDAWATMQDLELTETIELENGEKLIVRRLVKNNEVSQ